MFAKVSIDCQYFLVFFWRVILHLVFLLFFFDVLLWLSCVSMFFVFSISWILMTGSVSANALYLALYFFWWQGVLFRLKFFFSRNAQRTSSLPQRFIRDSGFVHEIVSEPGKVRLGLHDQRKRSNGYCRTPHS
jgi:hypothetical protein